MQTFLPVEDFIESARVLDMRRLGKQRVETWQIWLTLSNGSRWKNHPAVRMWDGHEWWLLYYGLTVCREWIKRGYRDSLLMRFLPLLEQRTIDPYPAWLGDERLHSSHRANLIRKDPIHYLSYGWKEDPVVGYYWPTWGS